MSAITDNIYPRFKVYVVGPAASAGPFDIPFPFYDNDTVNVYVDGVEITEYTITKPSVFGTEGNTVTLTAAVQNAVVTVASDTKAIRTTGATFTQGELSQELDRVFALFQEQSERLMEQTVDGTGFDAQNLRIQNVADPVNDTDAATKNYADTVLVQTGAARDAAQAAQTAAETAQSNAETAETNAETAETNAGNHEAKAQEWAEKAEDAEVEPGKFSALHWAAKAAAVNPDQFLPVDGSRPMTDTQVINAPFIGTEWSPSDPGPKARMIQFGHSDYMGFIPRISDNSDWDWGQRLCYGTGERGERGWFLGDEGVAANRLITRGYDNLTAPGAYWQNMSASRAALVTYTNTTGHILPISVRAIDSAGTLRSAYAAISVGGLLIAETSAIDRSSETQAATVFALVPAGATYFVNYVGPSGVVVSEFRA